MNETQRPKYPDLSRHLQTCASGGCEWGAGEDVLARKYFQMIQRTTCTTPGCDHVFYDDPNADTRQLCPKCGKTGRGYSVHVTLAATAQVTATAVVIKYPQALITEAERFCKATEYGVSIIIAHTAAEIATERALVEITEAKGLTSVAEVVSEIFRPFGITSNKKVRSFYTAISGDDQIAQTKFWNDLKKSDELRNSIVHRGAKATKDEAERAIQSTTELIKYLNQW